MGESWPEFEDYSEFLDDEPWIEENIKQILGSPFWHSDEVKRQVDIRLWEPNTWWWKRVYGQDAPTTDPATPETTETATEPEASPEPTTPVSAEPEPAAYGASETPSATVTEPEPDLTIAKSLRKHRRRR